MGCTYHCSFWFGLVSRSILFFSLVQVGGQEKIRRLWQHYYQNTDGLIFVVDSNDQERIAEAREELHGILSSPDMSDIPIVVIANKQDLPSKFTYVIEIISHPSLQR